MAPPKPTPKTSTSSVIDLPSGTPMDQSGPLTPDDVVCRGKNKLPHDLQIISKEKINIIILTRKNPQKKLLTSLVELTATPTPNQLLRDFNNGTVEADSEDQHVVRHRPAKWDADGPVRPVDP
uniref:Uncharacterized protein n=1 Tax=Caenorhabditis japonica TaxID=281687 RepID=A0A8R1II68_CAEJA